MANIANMRIEPCEVIWGEDRAHVSRIVVRGDSATDTLNNKYFFAFSANDAAKYHVWFNVANTGVDPAPAGSTGIEVDIAANANSFAVATALAAALQAHAAFSAVAAENVVTVTNAADGYASGPYEGLETGFSFTITEQGQTAVDVGAIEGDIELSGLGEDLEPITMHQEGTEILGHIRRGFTEVQVTVNFKETNKEQLKRLFAQGGASYRPVGAAATEVFGLGASKKFSNTVAQASKLVLHPKALPLTDRQRDLTFWKAYPMLDTITFSGETIMTVPVTFMIYPDLTKRAEVNRFVYGDGTQNFA